VVGTPITVGEGPVAIAITPNGRTAYVTNEDSDDVSVIDTQTNQVVGSRIEVNLIPSWVAITPDGRSAYVANYNGGQVSVIDTQTNQLGPPIKVAGRPGGIAIMPDGRTAYGADSLSNGVFVVNTLTNQLVGSTIPVGEGPTGVAINPDQPPHASFSDPAARPEVPVAFDASASGDPDGSIANYDWEFGDGAQASNGGPTPSHSYTKPGTYKATLTLTDNEGCSTSLIFTGQTAYCNGSALASQTQTVTVAYPGVRIKCPKSAKPRGCRFKLQAVTKKRKGKAETGVAKAKLKAGKSRIVSLKPRGSFASKLAAARKILVRETIAIGGSRRTSFRKLKVVQ
jgi:YVTN family beta-propeller protein